MADKGKSWEQSLRDNVAQVAYDTYQSGKNFIDDLKESPFKTIGGLMQKGSQVRQLDMIPEYVNPNDTYAFDPDKYSIGIENKLRNFDTDMKSYLEWNPMATPDDISRVENNIGKDAVDIDEYYNELYKAVGGVEGVYRGRQKAGLNTGKYTDKELEAIRDYTVDSPNLHKLSFETLNNISSPKDNIYKNTAMVSGNSKGNYKSESRNKNTGLTYLPFNTTGDIYDDVKAHLGHYKPYENRVGVNLDLHKYRNLDKNLQSIFHHEITHAKQNPPTNKYLQKMHKSRYENELLNIGKVPMNEIEASVSDKMFEWQKVNNKVMLSKKDFNDFIKNTDFYYGNLPIPKEVVKIVAPRMVKDDSKKMFQDLT